jgi:hypothetical protein
MIVDRPNAVFGQSASQNEDVEEGPTEESIRYEPRENLKNKIPLIYKIIEQNF